ncbi:MAG TPA: outer-membrane lipoprotein carrier protein LolA [Microvirga sp.]|nr:outer-membrane lipoprotein carrier protein LolA [Microvirga sp.]
MRNKSLFFVSGLAAALACSSPSMAQQASDPVTRFLDGMFKRNNPPPVAPAEQAAPVPAPVRPEPAQPARASQPAAQAKPQTPSRPTPAAQPGQQPRPVARETTAPRPAAAERTQAPPKPAAVEPARAQASPKPTAPAAVEAPKPNVTATRAPAAAAQSVPNSPAAALDRVNAYFNSIDQLTAYFVQTSTNGQRAEGTLAIKRPGQLHFAYAPPSSLEVVSDGRSVAVRDKRLGTNDVYSIRQTPLKFLVQDQVDLARDTQVKDVQIGSDGVVTVRFEDSATLGGTSKITLRFDARTNTLKQWTVLDAQGYETTVALSNVNMVRRASADAGN